VSLGVPAIAGTLVAVPCSLVIGSLVWVVRVSASLPGASVALESPASWVAAALCAACVGVAARPGLRRGLGAWLGRAAGTLPARRRSPTGPGAVGRAGPNPAPVAVAAPFATRPAAPRRPRTRIRGLDGRLRLLVALAAVALVSLGAVVASRPDGRLRLTVLDVGQGDAILLQSPRGARLLVDAGPDPDALLGALDAVVPAWDRRLDAVLLTHPHEDHVGGMAVLLRRYDVGRVYDNGMPGSGPGYAAYREALAARGIAARRLAAGDRLDLDGVVLRVLWPVAGTVPGTPSGDGTVVNDASIVLDVRYGERRFLLTKLREQLRVVDLVKNLARRDIVATLDRPFSHSAVDPRRNIDAGCVRFSLNQERLRLSQVP